MNATLDVIHRHDCELCDDMVAGLASLALRYKLPPVRVVDVDSDPELTRRFGFDVPVLVLDGTVVCRHELDGPELLRLLRHPPAA